MTNSLGRRAFDRFKWAALALTCTLTAGGCGNVVAGGATGDVDAYMTADESSASPASPSSTGPAATTLSPAIVGLGLEGELSVTSTLDIEHMDGPEVSLTAGGPVVVSTDLMGGNEALAGGAEVPAGPYVAVHIVFYDVTAMVTAGLELGGTAFTGAISVNVGSGGLEVVRYIDLDLAEGGHSELLVDLNADAWVPLADPVTGIVAAADFAGAVGVSVR